MDVSERHKVGIIDEGSNSKDKMIKRSPSKNSNKTTSYLTPEARLAFTKLRKILTKALILQHFDLESHIRIETDVSDYAIGGVLSQLTLDNLG